MDAGVTRGEDKMLRIGERVGCSRRCRKPPVDVIVRHLVVGRYRSGAQPGVVHVEAFWLSAGRVSDIDEILGISSEMDAEDVPGLGIPVDRKHTVADLPVFGNGGIDRK